MGRNILDADLRRWEPFATTAEGGLPAPGRIIFRCTSDPSERPRVVTVDGDKSRAERELVDASEARLRGWLEEAQRIR